MIRIRPVVPEQDLPALEELFEIVTVADGHRPIGEHVYLSLTAPSPDVGAGLVAERDGDVIGYVGLSAATEPGSWTVEFAIHPLWRSPELRRELIEQATADLVGRGARKVRVWTYHPDLAEGLVAEGFEPERELRQLRIALPTSPPTFPAGVEVRGFRPGVDEEAWLAVNNAAFVGHPENGAWTMDLILARERQEWFEAEGLRMAWDAADLAGFCWTKRHDGPLGEIYIIAVAPDRRRKGLGRGSGCCTWTPRIGRVWPSTKGSASVFTTSTGPSCGSCAERPRGGSVVRDRPVPGPRRNFTTRQQRPRSAEPVAAAGAPGVGLAGGGAAPGAGEILVGLHEHREGVVAQRAPAAELDPEHPR